MNAIITPKDNDIRNEYIQFNEVLFNNAVDMQVKIMNEKMLIHNLVPNLKLKVFLAMMNCIKHVTNCTQRLVKAAPCALKIGMNMKFNVRLMRTPIAATKFNCFKLPLAVSNVPKIYVIDIDTKLPISI